MCKLCDEPKNNEIETFKRKIGDKIKTSFDPNMKDGQMKVKHGYIRNGSVKGHLSLHLLHACLENGIVHENEVITVIETYKSEPKPKVSTEEIAEAAWSNFDSLEGTTKETILNTIEQAHEKGLVKAIDLDYMVAKLYEKENNSKIENLIGQLNLLRCGVKWHVDGDGFKNVTIIYKPVT